MSTLEEHVDVSVPVDTAWNSLHRVENYPRFVDGIRGARTEEGGRAHVDIDSGGGTTGFDAEMSDRGGGHVLEWRTTGGPELTGSFSLHPIDRDRTRVQLRLEYDPATVREAFGGPKGFAQASAIERLVRSDLEQFKEYLEHEG
ncbi:SRPBCC family protein [Streptomyces sp. WAC07094]|uniref:SRPBCC family protein n=1 Tax=Streptomyces sp. WAC07094 TaxID=3072183 RepID=UPI002EBBB8D3|nr:SRPBCC family protein [Streptomyces sp. WAC07094]